jgi:1-acyl-sn-glycerol-3-phosphate acyltransferase
MGDISQLKSGASVRRVQLCLYPVFRLASVFVIRSRRVELHAHQLDLAANRYVLVSNHQSGADFPIIGACLPMRVVWRLFPIRRMMYNAFFDARWLHRLNLATGVFPSEPHPIYPHGLAVAKALQAQGQTEMIFPEGQRTLPAESRPRRGIVALAEPPDVRVIPIHLQWHRSRHWRWVDVAIKSPIDAHGMSPQEVMTVVYGLPFGRRRLLAGLMARCSRATRSGAPAQPATPPE